MSKLPSYDVAINMYQALCAGRGVPRRRRRRRRLRPRPGHRHRARCKSARQGWVYARHVILDIHDARFLSLVILYDVASGTDPALHGGSRGGGGGGVKTVTVKPGLQGVADTAVSALCALAGVDAGDEVLEDGSRGAGAAGLAEVAVGGLEAGPALVLCSLFSAGPGRQPDASLRAGASLAHSFPFQLSLSIIESFQAR